MKDKTENAEKLIIKNEEGCENMDNKESLLDMFIDAYIKPFVETFKEVRKKTKNSISELFLILFFIVFIITVCLITLKYYFFFDNIKDFLFYIENNFMTSIFSFIATYLFLIFLIFSIIKLPDITTKTHTEETTNER